MKKLPPAENRQMNTETEDAVLVYSRCKSLEQMDRLLPEKSKIDWDKVVTSLRARPEDVTPALLFDALLKAPKKNTLQFWQNLFQGYYGFRIKTAVDAEKATKALSVLIKQETTPKKQKSISSVVFKMFDTASAQNLFSDSLYNILADFVKKSSKDDTKILKDIAKIHWKKIERAAGEVSDDVSETIQDLKEKSAQVAFDKKVVRAWTSYFKAIRESKTPKIASEYKNIDNYKKSSATAIRTGLPDAWISLHLSELCNDFGTDIASRVVRPNNILRFFNDLTQSDKNRAEDAWVRLLDKQKSDALLRILVYSALGNPSSVGLHWFIGFAKKDNIIPSATPRLTLANASYSDPDFASNTIRNIARDKRNHKSLDFSDKQIARIKKTGYLDSCFGDVLKTVYAALGRPEPFDLSKNTVYLFDGLLTENDHSELGNFCQAVQSMTQKATLKKAVDKIEKETSIASRRKM